MLNGRILVVGGYGQVGRVISTTLAKRFPGRVVAAGRRYHAAQRLSVESGGAILPLEIDVCSDAAGEERVKDVSLVVICLDQHDTGFVEACLRRGIHYVDISAGYNWLARVESLDGVARTNGATAVLSVGLAPGVTNLLAGYCKSLFDEMRHADIFIMLGLGDAHGEAAIRWFIQNLNADFPVRDTGGLKRARSFEDGKQTLLPDAIGKRTAYRFPFSDQQVIPRTLDLASASTWLCFDSTLVTDGLALAKRAGLLGVLRFPSVQMSLGRLLKMVHVGSDRFTIKAEARGILHGQQAVRGCSLSGREEARVTGLIAAEVASRLYTSAFPPGVFHIEQLFSPLEVFAMLAGHGVQFASDPTQGKARNAPMGPDSTLVLNGETHEPDGVMR